MVEFKIGLADRIVGSKWHKAFTAWLNRLAHRARSARDHAEWDAGFFRYGDAKLSRAACVNALWIDAAVELVEAGAAEWDGVRLSPRGTGFLDQFKASGLKPTSEEFAAAGAVLQREYGPIRVTEKGFAMVKQMRGGQ